MSDISKVKVFRNRYQKVKNILLDDVVKKINHDVDNDQFTGLVYDNDIYEEKVTMAGLSNYRIGTVDEAYSEVSNDIPEIETMHLYLSTAKDSKCFDRHKDKEVVFLVQCIGTMSYGFDDGKIYTMNPGDALYIPSEVYHKPIVNSQRVTMSFGLPATYKMEE